MKEKHGMSKTRIYNIWHGMIWRCSKPNSVSYPWYGAKGITYDPRWSNFLEFYEDMKEGYADNLSIDRIDGKGNYCKENCRWVDIVQQNLNRNAKNLPVLIEYNGKTKTLSEWSKVFGVSRQSLSRHYKRHGSFYNKGLRKRKLSFILDNIR